MKKIEAIFLGLFAAITAIFGEIIYAVLIFPDTVRQSEIALGTGSIMTLALVEEASKMAFLRRFIRHQRPGTGSVFLFASSFAAIEIFMLQHKLGADFTPNLADIASVFLVHLVTIFGYALALLSGRLWPVILAALAGVSLHAGFNLAVAFFLPEMPAASQLVRLSLAGLAIATAWAYGRLRIRPA